MASPNISQGTLNRLKASLVLPAFPELNVTAPFLGKEGIGLAFEGDATTMIPQMTGTVTSPEPYQLATILVRLIRTQSLSDLYKQQMESSTLLGDITLRPDTVQPGLSPYSIINCAITHVGDLTFNGMDAGFGVSIKGTYPLNATLWD